MGDSVMSGDVAVTVTPPQGLMGETRDRFQARWPLPARSEVFWLRWRDIGWSQREAAEFLGVSLRTQRRQESGAEPPRKAYVEALRLRSGDLGAIHPAWQGARLYRDGRLYMPGYRYGFTQGDILAEYFKSQLIAELKRKVAALQEELNGLRQLELGSDLYHFPGASNDAIAE